MYLFVCSRAEVGSVDGSEAAPRRINNVTYFININYYTLMLLHILQYISTLTLIKTYININNNIAYIININYYMLTLLHILIIIYQFYYIIYIS